MEFVIDVPKFPVWLRVALVAGLVIASWAIILSPCFYILR